jgi:hypothetical protein
VESGPTLSNRTGQAMSTRYFSPILAAWLAVTAALAARGAEPIHVGFLWHMHQPVYYPGETITQTNAAGHFSFSVTDVHNQRLGPYTTWPRDAIQSGLALPHLGAQVSFSGSLIQNLNALKAAGVNGGQWNNWEAAYKQAAQWDTSLGNPRLDLVNFGFNHPLMPLLDTRDIRMQIKLQKRIHEQTWGPNVPFSKGIFPPETAFSTRIIPALVAEGIEWAIVDSIHIERATIGYPHTNSSNIYAPNRADQINPDITASGSQWVQLNNLWAPSKVAAPFAYRPHHVQYVDPTSGAISQIVAVPGARYEGNEDGRGGFGALQYESVMEQYRQLNTDPNHPMFVLLHHDGDNFGGGSESYYHGNFQNMVNWAQSNANYDVTTVDDYLERFPVAPGDVVHIANGSWAGADAGDPEFKKWLGDPNSSGWSPDRNSWAVLTAAKNRVFTADDVAPATNLDNILSGVGTPTERAWRHLMAAQSSDYWYWDGTEVWDSNVTRGSNLAVSQADQVLTPTALANEQTPPTIFLPQRESYNPGGIEWNTSQPQPSDFEIWTYAYDVSGLTDVTLKWRVDGDGFNPLSSTHNETYAGGSEVGAWNSISMNSSDFAPPGNILSPTYRALRYGAMITGQQDVLIDYYVEAVDGRGNIARSDIQHVYVGQSSPPGGTNVVVNPDPLVAGQLATISYDPGGGPLSGASQVYLHYGFNNWQTVLADVAMNWNSGAGLWQLSLPMSSNATQFDFVFNNGSGVWDNNNGQDWHYAVEGGQGPPFVMDGLLDATAEEVASNGGRHLYAALAGDVLYLATEDAGEGHDVFIYLAKEPGPMRAANWAKAGQIAGWDAYLADENNNDFEAWFDASGETAAATGANGGVLEGTINLAQEFGSLPAAVYVAVGLYHTANGGALVPSLQVPASLDGNGNIEALEYFLLQLVAAPGDYDRDGDVDVADYNLWRSTYGQTEDLRADGNGDGIVDAADYTVWRNHMGQGSGAGGLARYVLTAVDFSDVAPVPEPTTLVLLGLSTAVMIASLRRCDAIV